MVHICDSLQTATLRITCGVSDRDGGRLPELLTDLQEKYKGQAGYAKGDRQYGEVTGAHSALPVRKPSL